MSGQDGTTEEPQAVSRRQVLHLGGALAAAMVACGSPSARADEAAGGAVVDDESLERAIPELSNWHRWGADDQLGTLNFLTADKRVAAAALIRSGRLVPLGREFGVSTPELRNFSYTMRSYDDPLPEESGCYDIVALTCHGFGITHVDALCHMFTPLGKEGMYNGYPISNVTDTGASTLGIEHVGATGIVGRGVLLDIAEIHGGPLPLGTAITLADLEAAEQAHNVIVGEGDIVFVRNGAGARNTYRRASGLHAACLPWLRDRRVAVLSSDSDSDVHPPISGFSKWAEPIHMVAIPYMGLVLLDHAELDGLAQACAQEDRWEFFVSAAPWRFRGSTGSAINPLAIF